jgi:signal transduction histidine kinase/ActR/RegA family two-component response regulator
MTELRPSFLRRRAELRGGPGGQRVAAGVAFVVLCLAGMIALPYWTASLTAGVRGEIRSTLAPLQITTERLHREVLAMAAALRGHQLTGAGSFAQAFEEGEQGVRADFGRARGLAERAGGHFAAEVTAAEEVYELWVESARPVIAGSVPRPAPEEAQVQPGIGTPALEPFTRRMNRLTRILREREEELADRLARLQRTERQLVLVLGTLAAVVLAYLVHLAVSLLRARRDLADALERKDRFLATISHELRTPLTPILGWIELLREEQDPARRARGLEAIRRNVALEAQLVDDLLDLSRVVNQKLQLDFRRIDASAALRSAVDTVRHLADAKRIPLVVELPDGPLVIVADETRVVQVAWNLLSNAIKFSPPGAPVRLAASASGDGVVVVVEDGGEGILPHQLQHVFEPFEQPGVARHGRRGGLGIGLALARSLVELHGGWIRGESDGSGRGSRFTFHLPPAPPGAARAVEAPEADASPGGAGESVARGRRAAGAGDELRGPTGAGAEARSRDGADADVPRVAPFGPESTPARGLAAIAALRRAGGPPRGTPLRRVLLVEDSADTQEALRLLLQEWGYEVSTATELEGALREAARVRPEVVISDIALSHGDGLQLARELRRAEEVGGNARAMMVGVSGWASEADRGRALDAGFDEYLAKPVNLGALRRLLESAGPRRHGDAFTGTGRAAASGPAAR